MKAVIYSRCSTDEDRQDVDMQLKELRRYAGAYEWECDEVSEYGSGFKGCQPKLKELLEEVRCKKYDVFLVYDFSRFSREHPSKTNALLDRIVYEYKCRFISLKDGIDSDNEMTWHVVKPLFTYFSNIFSRNLSEKIKNGIKNKKEKGEYNGGRPAKETKVDVAEVKRLYAETNSLRETAKLYNANRYKDNRISYVSVKRLLDKENSVLQKDSTEVAVQETSELTV